MRQPERTIPGTPRDWLRYARSSFALASAPRQEGVLWENLCFETQQAAEKAVKAVLQQKGIVFPYVHDLQVLLDLLGERGDSIPENVKQASVLTRYAFQTRYPGDYEPVTEADYHRAIEQAKAVLDWAASIVERDFGATQKD